MPREARKKSKTGIYHIILRGINKQTIFEDKEDKRVFLQTLVKFKDISKYQLYGYCVMDNHVHLLIREMEESLSTSIKRISSSYVYWYNKKYTRCGHLFQERYKSENVEDKKYFLIVLRYIHQNPIKAKLATSIMECEWTSIHEYAHHPKITNPDPVFKLFSSNKREATSLLMEFMNKQNNDKCLEIEETIKLSDEDVRQHIKAFGVPSSAAFQRIDRKKRNELLIKLKKIEGVSLRQLSRVTGFSKTLIQRLC